MGKRRLTARAIGRTVLARALAGLLISLVIAVIAWIACQSGLGYPTSTQLVTGRSGWLVSITRLPAAERIRLHVDAAWSPQQATGKPDVTSAGDNRAAWASLQADGPAQEWLQLTFPEQLRAVEARIYETYNPGAVMKMTTFDAGGKESILWSGVDPVARDAGMGVATIPIAPPETINRIRIYIDSSAVPGWNEIDAVALLDGAGRAVWASGAEASSWYNSGGGGTPVELSSLPAWLRREPQPTSTTERVIDGFGWPVPALHSRWEGPVRSANTSWLLPGGRVPLPYHVDATGLLVDTIVCAVLWSVLLLILLVPLRFIRDLSRMRRGRCICCGYDLQYDFTGGCSECGWRRDPTAERAS